MSYFGSTDFLIEVAKGKVPGHSIVNVFGRNNDIDTGTTPESIWHGGDLYDGFNATGAETVNISSASANDTSAGTGARTILIDGLDASFNPQTETIIMNGTSNVTSVNSYIRQPNAYVLTAGSGGVNAGVISSVQSSSGVQFMAMPAETNQTHIACYTVPTGYTGYIVALKSTLNDANNTSARMDIFIREEGSVFRSKIPFGISQGGGSVGFGDGCIPQEEAEEKADIDCRCITTSSNGTDVSIKMAILLVDNDYI